MVSWASEIALAVHHLHERGMIHLNIGVHSVFICADGQAKLDALLAVLERDLQPRIGRQRLRRLHCRLLHGRESQASECRAIALF